MKKRKLLYLFPLTALLLSGCSFQEALDKAKGFLDDKIINPIKDIFGPKDEQQDEDEHKEDGGGETEVTIRYIELENYPHEVVLNRVIEPKDVSIKVIFSDKSEKTVQPEEVICDTSKVGETELVAKYKGQECSATIKVLSEEDVVHAEDLSVDALYVNLHVGDTHQIVTTFLPENTTDQTCSYVVDNEQLASVSSTGFVTALAAGIAKVTVTSNDNENLKKTVQFTIEDVAAGLPGSTKAGYAKLSATETLKNGEKVNFAGAIGDKFYAMPNYTSGNNIKAKEVSTEDGKLVIEDITEETTTFTHEFTVIDNGDETYSFMQANGKYLSAAGGSSSNHLKVVDSINDTAKFSVAVDADGNAQLTASKVGRGYMCLNPNGGNPIFSCYSEAKYEKYAVYHDGKGSSDHVPVEGIAFGEQTYKVEEGSSVELSVSVLPALATDKEYSLSIQSAEPEGCVSLNGNVLTGNAVGNAVILAKSHENAEITATVPVEVFAHVERNYGSLESPLSIAEAKAIIDLDGGTAKQEMYVKGEVSKNDAYSSNYKNTNIWLKDGADEFELYGAKLPEGFEPDQPVKNDAALVGKIVVAHGMGKIYGSTYEFDKNCQVDSVKDNDTPVESVSLDRNELNMEVGMPDETLVATVLPADAGNKKVVWESSNPEVATVTEGVVHAVAAGDATITVKSVANNEKTASCTVHVTQPEKQLTGIEVTTMPKVEYTEGDLLDLSGMVVTLHYDDESSAEITSGWTTNIAADHPLTSEDTSLVVSFGGFDATAITLTITAKPQPVHAGTAEDPYTGEDAVIVANNLAAGGVTDDSYYVKGVVVSFEENFNPSYGNYSFKIEGGFIGWRLLNGESKAKFSTGDLEIGDTVTMYVQIQSYIKNAGDTPKPESKNGYIVSIEKPYVDVEGVSLDKDELNLVVGMPDETLVATVSPEEATNKAVEWESSNPEVATVNEGVVHAVAAGEATITVKSVANNEKTASCTVHVTQPEKQLTGIEVTTMPKVEYTEGDLLDLSGMVVTLHYDDESSTVITSGWTTNIAADHPLTSEDTSLVVSFGGFSADPIVLTINVPEAIIAEGVYYITATEDNVTYYLKSNGTTAAPSAVTDSTQATEFTFTLVEGKTDEYEIKAGDSYLYSTDANNGVRIGSTAATWKIAEGSRDGGGFDMSTVTGSTTRFLSLYNKADFRGYNSATATNRHVNTNVEVPVVKTLQSITVEGPTKVDYEVGQSLNTEGLVVTAHYLVNEEIEDRVLEASEYTLSQQGAFAEGDIGDKTIVVSFGEKTAEFVVHITAASEVPPTEETRVEFTMGENGSAAHADGSSATTYSETVQGYTLSITDGVKMFSGARDAAGNSCLKFGTSSAGGSFNIDLSGVSGVKKIIVLAAQYKANSDCAITVGSNAAVTLTSKSNNGSYDEIEYEVGSSTSVSVSFSKRAMMNGIIFVF